VDARSRIAKYCSISLNSTGVMGNGDSRRSFTQSSSGNGSPAANSLKRFGEMASVVAVGSPPSLLLPLLLLLLLLMLLRALAFVFAAAIRDASTGVRPMAKRARPGDTAPLLAASPGTCKQRRTSASGKANERKKKNAEILTQVQSQPRELFGYQRLHP